MMDKIKMSHSIEDFKRIKRLQSKRGTGEIQLYEDDGSEEKQPESRQARKFAQPGRADVLDMLIRHLNSTRMMAGEIELKIEKLLLDAASENDEFRSLKISMEGIKRTAAEIGAKQAGLNDWLLEIMREMDRSSGAGRKADIRNLGEVIYAKMDRDINNACLKMRQETDAAVERLSAAVYTKIDREIRRIHTLVDERVAGFARENPSLPEKPGKKEMPKPEKNMKKQKDTDKKEKKGFKWFRKK